MWRATWLLLAQQAQTSSGGQSQPEGCAVDAASGSCVCADAVGNSWDLGPDLGTLGPITGPCNGLFCSGEWRCALPFRSTTCSNQPASRVHCLPSMGFSFCIVGTCAAVPRVTLHCVWCACVDYRHLRKHPSFPGHWLQCGRARLCVPHRHLGCVPACDKL